MAKVPITVMGYKCDLVRIHSSLRVSPAMAAGVSDRLWSLEDMAVGSNESASAWMLKIKPSPLNGRVCPIMAWASRNAILAAATASPVSAALAALVSFM